MRQELIDLVENLGLQEQFSDVCDKNIPIKQIFTHELLELCLDNGKYKLLIEFPDNIWQSSDIDKIKDHLGDMLEGHNYSINFPGIFYESPIILNKFLDLKPLSNYVSKFKSPAMTKENIEKLVSLYGEDYSYNFIFNRNTDILPNIIELGKPKLLKSYSNKDITEEIADKIIEVSKTKPDYIKEIPIMNDILLRKIIENNLYTSDRYYPNEVWTDENLQLMANSVRNNKIKLSSSITSIKGIGPYIAPVIIDNKLFDFINCIGNDYWTDENVDKFINVVDEYIKEERYIPSYLYNNPKLLSHCLEKEYVQVNCFNEPAWTIENMTELFSNKKNMITGTNFYTLLSSKKCLEEVINNKKTEFLEYFKVNNLDEEMKDKIVELYSENKDAPVGYYTQMMPGMLDKILNSNNLTTASNFEYNQCWNDERRKKYFELLKSYDGKINYTNACIDKYNNAIQNIALNTYLITDRYEGIKKYLNSNEDVWTEENINIIEDNIEKYKKLNLIPYAGYYRSKILSNYLDNEDIVNIKKFQKNAWDDQNLVKYINLFKEDKTENITYVYFANDELNTPYRKYIFTYIKHNQYNLLNESKKINEISKIQVEDTKTPENNYYKLIQETQSLKIMTHLLYLTDGDYDKIPSLFDESGPKQEIHDELIFDEEYINYCIDNNINIPLSTKTLHSYFNFVKKYPALANQILFTKDNINDYFDESGPKKKLFESLYNNKSANLLYEIDKKENILPESRKYILEKYINITENDIKHKFLNYCKENEKSISKDKVDGIYQVLKRIETSNSSEILRFKVSLADQVIKFDNPEEKLEEVEKIFLQNNLPNVGKIFLVFKELYPNYNRLLNRWSSPTLKENNDFKNDTIIFSDLLKIALGSNNRDLNNYINNLINGNKIYRKIKLDNISVHDLSKEEQQELKEFLSHVDILYKNTIKGKKNERKKSEDIIKEIEDIKRLLDPKETEEFELPDRIIYMFAHAAGFDNIESIVSYQKDKLKAREEYHRSLANKKVLKIQKGDLIKGINDIKYLSNILQNGSVCKEFLGDSADSDATPLDTDLSLIEEESDSLEQAINKTSSKGYGSTFFVLKNDNRFTITRTSDGKESPTNRKDKNIELFKTGFLNSGHYGIRTGFSASDIDYIITKENPNKICLDIALNGTYIPVVDINGNVIFTYEDYKNIRNNMQGLSYHNQGDKYNISKEINEDINVKKIVNQLDDSRKDINNKQQAIYNVIAPICEKYGYKLQNKLSTDLTNGTIECIDTGSTGRGTNIPNDADFDFIMRLDRELLTDEKKLNEFKKDLLKAFNKEDGLISTGDFRLKEVEIDGISIPLDIDISFVVKTNDINYSTDMCIKDRLDTIKKLYPDKYDEVIANIILAKQILKENHCYKANRGDHPEGGLCGVGVENWILQNGGSLIEAAKRFVQEAENKSFEEFKKTYKVYNYGENFLAQRRGQYVHDNYVADNMSESGYNLMKETLKRYIKAIELGKMFETTSENSKENNIRLSH